MPPSYASAVLDAGFALEREVAAAARVLRYGRGTVDALALAEKLEAAAAAHNGRAFDAARLA